MYLIISAARLHFKEDVFSNVAFDMMIFAVKVLAFEPYSFHIRFKQKPSPSRPLVTSRFPEVSGLWIFAILEVIFLVCTNNEFLSAAKNPH